jgi:hypothetical protein
LSPGRFHAAFALEHQLRPWFNLTTSGRLADSIGQHGQPAFLVSSAIRVEINNLAISEANTETFFDEHVALLLFGEGGLSSATTSGSGLLLSER